MRYRPQRWPSDYRITVTTPRGREHVAVVNVSSTGAKLTGLTAPQPGDSVSFPVLQNTIRATVVWVADQTAGVRFTLPIGSKPLAVLRQSRAGLHRPPGAAAPRWDPGNLREMQ